MIRKVSIPLVVGMIVAAGVGPSPLFASLSLTAAALFFILCSLRKIRSFIPFYLLLFFTGFFCYCSMSVYGAGHLRFEISDQWLRSAIEGTGFEGERTSPLLKALLTGDRSELDRGTVDCFRSSGAAHLLALSGLHLGIIYLIISRVLSVLGHSLTAHRCRSILCIGLSGAYTIMTGAGPSIVRAFLFITLNELASLHPERKKDGLSIFWTALTIQTVINPTVIESAGFQLSYLAMLGIFLVFPVLRDFYPSAGNGHGLLEKADITHRIWDSAALAISCQLFTAPLAYLLFGSFPRYFLLSNLIAMPLTELLIPSALVCLALSSLGVCPDFAIRAVNSIASALINSLEIIAGM